MYYFLTEGILGVTVESKTTDLSFSIYSSFYPLILFVERKVLHRSFKVGCLNFLCGGWGVSSPIIKGGAKLTISRVVPFYVFRSNGMLDGVI